MDLGPWLTRWRLTPDGPAFETRYGQVLRPVRTEAGERAMLKLSASEEERRGAATLAWYGGQGAARVLALEGEALLMERLDGPRSLTDMVRAGDDQAATLAICSVVEALHAPRTAQTPRDAVPLRRWFATLERAAGEDERLAGAWATAAHLLAEPRAEVVLHGDIHHDNVLDSDRGWLAIDPKGLVGERAFDYANILANPCRVLDVVTAPGRLRRQVEIAAGRSGVGFVRLAGFVHAWFGLSCAFALDEGGVARDGFALLDLAARLLDG